MVYFTGLFATASSLIYDTRLVPDHIFPSRRANQPVLTEEEIIEGHISPMLSVSNLPVLPAHHPFSEDVTADIQKAAWQT